MRFFPPSRAVGAAIRMYQIVLAGRPRRCRFHPSCSDYAREAVERDGVVRGAAQAARRLARCHPFHPGGYDPLPDRRTPEGAR